MKKRFWRIQTAVMFAALLCLGLFTATAGAEEMLQNTGFESYDAGTLVPDNWVVLDGSVEAYTGDFNEGAASAYSLGGSAVYDEENEEWVVTPNATQGGTLVQLIDLSTMTGYADGNWIDVSLSMYTHLWCGTSVYMYLEYLPPSYNGDPITADDAAWSSSDVVTATYTSYTYTRTTWRKSSTTATMPKTRWARVRLVYDVTWNEDSDFDEDGDYYIAVDTVSLDAEMIEPETPCTDNLLSNPGFESASGGVPTAWNVLSGRMTAIDLPAVPAYNGDIYAGNICGEVIDDVDYPDPPQNGSLVQLVDLSSLTDWSDASFLTFQFSLFYMRNRIQEMSYTVEYLPEDYNETEVTWDDAAWDTDAETAVTDSLSHTGAKWLSTAVGPGSLTKVRWVRVRLDVDDGELYGSNHSGPYLGGFDQVCLQAEAVVAGDLIRNSSFEDISDSKPVDWYEDPDDGPVWIMIEPQPAPDGAYWLGKPLIEEQLPTTTVYQVIDLADKIPGWTAIEPEGGGAVENQFIQLALSALVTNIGGTSVKVGLEYLPYSYNEVEGVTWDDTAWEPRDWSSDGSAFTNNGGDAIDAGYLIEDTTVTDPYTEDIWREVSSDGWLPRVRWIRLRIEMDATDTGGTMAVVGIDALNMSAFCTQWGPYSGFGNLPEATFYEDPDAPDKPVPAWVGPEGDGISGGYTGQTEQNYVNPVFAGFADSVADYTPSGQYIYNVAFEEPLAITGRPWNDAGWNYVIVTLGDLTLDYLADYFGPSPSGTYQPGSITAVFNESPIANGDGHDFATFENGFSSGWTSPWIFAELAYVEVSSNGTDFIRFPTHSLTPKWPGAYGCILASGVFGLTGKHINAYGDAWGTPFDLDWIADHPMVLNGTVDLNDIRYVRQVDVPGGGPEDAQGLYTGFFHDDYNNVIFDSWPTWGSGGVDLDAVAVINTSATDSDGDNIVDYWDNCPATPNEKQYDTDEDGYGNACDCDIDGDEGGDGTVGAADFSVFRAAYGATGPIMIPGAPGEDNTYAEASENWNADADFNGDLAVGPADFAIFRARYGSSAPFE